MAGDDAASGLPPLLCSLEGIGMWGYAPVGISGVLVLCSVLHRNWKLR